MSLRKPPTMTPARIEANRRNARKSTGPRTARGKAQVRFNALKNGNHSRLYQDFRMFLRFLPPCAVLGPREFVTPEMARHQLFAEALENAIWAETETCLINRELNSRAAPRRGN
jgi:hypothetical protein